MPGEDIYSWSTTAADNATADSSINFAEGQPRASVNNSARAQMAAHAKQRDLLSGSIATSGTANAQTFTSGVGYTTVPTGLRVLLKIGPGLTNTAATTLGMDGISAVAIKTNSGGDLVAGMLIENTYNEFRYDGTNWILLRDATDYVNVSGDTMTGALTVPALVSTGNVTAASSSVTLGSSSVTIGTMQLVSAGHQYINFQGTDWGLAWNVDTGTFQITLGAANVALFQSTGSAIIAANLFIGGTGLKPGGGPWADSSDARIKNVVGDYTTGLDAIKQVRPVNYTFKGNDTSAAPDVDDTVPYKNSPHKTVATENKEFVGVVAQEVEAYLPELVTQADGYVDGAAVTDLRMLDTAPLVYALINAVKELAARVEALEAK